MVFLVAVSVLLSAALVSAQTQSDSHGNSSQATAAPSPAAAASTGSATASAGPVLPEGTEITVQLAHDTRTNNMGQGDPVEYVVSDDVFATDAAHTLVLPKGAIAMGRVIRRSKAWEHGPSGRLDFTCEYAVAADGRKVWLRSTQQRSGAVLVPIQAKHSSSPIQVEQGIMRRPIGFEAGTQFLVYVDQDFVLKPNH
jgi:hypothetical protein